jgi:hypothetical protein
VGSWFEKMIGGGNPTSSSVAAKQRRSLLRILRDADHA